MKLAGKMNLYGETLNIDDFKGFKKNSQKYWFYLNNIHRRRMNMRVKDITVKKNLSVDQLIKFIETANKFESDIKIKRANFTVDAKSIIGVLTIVRAGIEVTITAIGDDDEEALKAIINLLI